MWKNMKRFRFYLKNLNSIGQSYSIVLNLKVLILFESVVMIVFQSVFHLEMYQNNILKKYIFNISVSK